MVHAAMPIKWRRWQRGGEGKSMAAHREALCGPSCPAAPSSWFVCGTLMRKKVGASVFFFLSMNSLLFFLMHPHRCSPSSLRAHTNTRL